MNMNRLFTCLCLSLLFNLAQAQLLVPKYQKGKTILSGAIVNHHPNDNLVFKIGAPNIVMGTAETLYPTVEPDGSFTINVPLCHHAQVRMMIGNADLIILLSPEKETNVAIDLSNPPGRQFVFNGQYATINNEWCQPKLITKIPPVCSDGDLLDSIVGISVDGFKKRCINQYKRYVTHSNAQLQSSEDTRTLASLSCAFDYLENLQATHCCLQIAYQKKENIIREQAFAAFLDVYLPGDFRNYLKDFPVNRSLAPYYYSYRNVVMDLYDTRKDPLAYEENLLKNAPLTKEEQTLIHQYETAFKAGISFQQENELMVLSARYFKENDLFEWESFFKAKERLSNIIQDSTSLIVDYI